MFVFDLRQAQGVGVLVATGYRLLVHQQPDVELMGIFGLIGLGINVTAALVLIPHRQGDANVRAVWLFSRNDAIGNVAVVIAAVLVAWTPGAVARPRIGSTPATAQRPNDYGPTQRRKPDRIHHRRTYPPLLGNADGPFAILNAS
jgi:hypothetical protein